ncbi:hypothetical protein FHS85_003914 [Rhodoligotrophos appendicifer]|uniref:hypothetical protein n=1 Tax=Rhodoligotrophos appendicifer TaxID=987056 RepID=UPI001184ADFF|nr:hypothetical protein [Rhodoligotrophos appendicifer]
MPASLAAGVPFGGDPHGGGKRSPQPFRAMPDPLPRGGRIEAVRRSGPEAAWSLELDDFMPDEPDRSAFDEIAGLFQDIADFATYGATAATLASRKGSA